MRAIPTKFAYMQSSFCDSFLTFPIFSLRQDLLMIQLFTARQSKKIKCHGKTIQQTNVSPMSYKLNAFSSFN